MTYTVNHFGHFYLTYLLFDAIKKAKEGRIIHVSSLGHNWSTDNLLDDMAYEKNWSSMDSYSNSKMFNVMFAVGLNNLFKEKNIQNVKTASLHPGFVESNLGGDSCLAECIRCICCCFVVKNETGARTSLYLSRVPFE